METFKIAVDYVDYVPYIFLTLIFIFIVGQILDLARLKHKEKLLTLFCEKMHQGKKGIGGKK